MQLSVPVQFPMSLLLCEDSLSSGTALCGEGGLEAGTCTPPGAAGAQGSLPHPPSPEGAIQGGNV